MRGEWSWHRRAGSGLLRSFCFIQNWVRSCGWVLRRDWGDLTLFVWQSLSCSAEEGLEGQEWHWAGLWGRGCGGGAGGRDGVGVLLGDWQECSRDRHSVGSSQDGSGGNGKMVMRSKTEKTRVNVSTFFFSNGRSHRMKNEARMYHFCSFY